MFKLGELANFKTNNLPLWQFVNKTPNIRLVLLKHKKITQDERKNTSAWKKNLHETNLGKDL